MKKFTLVFALIFSVMCVMGQKTVKTPDYKHIQENQTALEMDLNKMSSEAISTKAPGDVVYTQGFAGAWLPEGWTLISTETGNNTWRQLTTTGNPAPSAAITHAGAPLFRDEKLISPVISVPLDNPYFLFDFSTSDYWLVGQNSDDMKIYVSTDGGETWGNHIWAEDDAAMVTGSLVPFPYLNFTWYTARMDFSAYAGEDVKIMFHFLSNVGGAQMGVSFYLDNVTIMEYYTDEITIGGQLGAANMNYGFYSALPKTQVNAASGLNFFQVPVANTGLNAQTNVLLNVNILKAENSLFTTNSNAIASLAAFTRDTFLIGNRDPQVQTTPLYVFPAEIADYKIRYNVSQDEEDQNPTNNTRDINFKVTSDYLSRHTAANSTAGVLSFTGGAAGDYLGMGFVLTQPDQIKGGEIYLSTAATLDNSFRLDLYNGEDNSLLAQSEIIDIIPGMPGTWIYVEFEEPVDVIADNYYHMGITSFVTATTDNQSIGVERSNFLHWYNYTSVLRLGAEWWYTSSFMPAVYVYFERALHNVTFVVNDPDGEPVTDAVITLGATTNEAGNYVFQVAEGTYNYTITAAGFETATGTVTVGDGDETVTVGLTVGIENNLVENLMVYPNPVRNALNVKFNVTDNMPVSVQLISADGRVVYSEKAQVNGQYNSTLDMSGNANGVYFLRIETAAGVTHQKVMKF